MISETDTTILIIDDPPESVSAPKELRRPKYRMLAASRASALRVTSNLPKSGLIPLDMMIPDMDDFKALTRQGGKHFDPDLADVFLAGFDGFIAKRQAERSRQENYCGLSKKEGNKSRDLRPC